MPISSEMNGRLRNGHLNPTAPRPKRGAEIFAGNDYPQTWDGFVGQTQAKEQLSTALHSATVRNARLDHILLASGIPGCGKTTLIHLLAASAGVGLVMTSGPLTVDDMRRMLGGMTDRDILGIDEAHLLVQGNRNRADWLLPFLTDGVLLTAKGVEKAPDVTVVMATTEAGKLPQTLVSRFMLRPLIAAYTDDEAAQIVANLAGRMRVKLGGGQRTLARIARAANNNPRDMRMILTAVRDLASVGPVDLNKAFAWAGLTADGLTQEARDILLVLAASKNHTSSLEGLQATLGEPGPLRHAEQILLRKALITVTGRGRTLTEDGLERARQLIVTESLG